MMPFTKGNTQNYGGEASSQSVQFGFLTWIFLKLDLVDQAYC